MSEVVSRWTDEAELTVALYSRVASLSKFFELFTEATEHEFFVDLDHGHDEILKDWQLNCSLVKYTLEPVYLNLAAIIKNPSYIGTDAQQIAKRNLSRCLVVQSFIVEASEWLNEQAKFTDAVKKELVSRLRNVDVSLDVWRERQLRNLIDIDTNYSSLARQLGEDSNARDKALELANHWFQLPKTCSKKKLEINGGLEALILQMESAVGRCSAAIEERSTKDFNDFGSPPMEMCMKGRGLYLAVLDAIVTGPDTLFGMLNTKVLDVFDSAMQITSNICRLLKPDESETYRFDNLLKSFENLRRRFEVLREVLPDRGQFDHSSLRAA